MIRGTPRRPRPGTGRPAGWLKATVRRQGLTTPWLPRRLRAATSGCTKSWPKPRARHSARPGRRKSSCEDFCFDEGCPGLFPRLIHTCGRGDQTAAHLFAECMDNRSRGLRAFGYTTKEEVHRGLSHHDTAPDVARALVQSGWLPQFRVFNELQCASSTTEGNSHAWARRPPPPQPARVTKNRGAA